MTSTTLTDQVTDAQLQRYADLVYKRTGIRLSPQKKTLLSNRLRRRLKATGIEGFDAYLSHLRKLGPEDPEWDAFLQEITTHETYLFRDEKQWAWFQKEFLSQINADVRAGKRPRSLRIWSAACSTGDECYTMATCVAATLPNLAQWKVEIIGTDIGIGALEQGRKATFGERAMRLVDDSYRRRYFTKAKEAEQWTAKPILQEMVSLEQHNLMEPLSVAPFDLIFVKNVLIYFDPPSKKTVLGHVKNLMKPGGLLLAGAAEGVSDHLQDLERLQAWLYRRAD